MGLGGEPRALWAVDPATSRGRLVAESPSPTRTPFQRDRDRIVHSTAFRRLAHKTQVFLHTEGDHFRSRLTHTLEVAQIARALARAFRLDEDLAEALALGHDLGHTPFGHAGERAMGRAMAEFGGFDHNAQTLRIVTRLERRYAAFDGLNLAWETLEGLVKHNGPLTDATGRPLPPAHGDGPPDGLLPYAIRDYAARQDLWLWSWPSLEAQCAAIADDIAYDAHDIDDGLRAGLLDLESLEAVPLVGGLILEVRRLHPGLDRSRLIQETIRRLITRMIEDVVAESFARLETSLPESADEVRYVGHALIVFSPEIAAADREIKRHLFRHVYRCDGVMTQMRAAERVVEALFAAYMETPSDLPEEWRRDLDVADRPRLARRVCDYIAGMTDRFALIEHRRRFDDTPELV
ncbi:deoxyguanosinetriphosphate triphosphohydrolase [Siculibacillus lacustris]|uniref:Deoxyguanosinetriphosphate triphosphohydrolase-like protein n=1 Tax=Siculibacillus lacustris TaxID=1549641 RepID=A0A4Q9VSN1_9HYPH|nr:deoxyguanosinetriphosphate triphosphohydrolase [Siculibacillus lacustris]